ncbi:MAG: beta-mannosidase, partial [Lachnospiraceae bacterium]|nr:beta-mannosidase [Candidatus Merdinaster equi]
MKDERMYIPCNPNAQEGVKNVLKYLADVMGDKIVTGQHTQEMEQAERVMIKELTGKEPALLGFELLSYSPNINYYDTDEPCMKEVRENRGTLEKAWEWAKEKGLITFTWHWFSPLYGRSKAFYTEFTEFDASKAVTEGTPEYAALISDMDVMAGILRPFCDKKIPILWRPFHEGDGTWFWWGAKGEKPLVKLYRIMYDRFTNIHHLDNLIWVWNAPGKERYPGDDVVDIISRDLYPTPHEHTARQKEYEELLEITETP